MDYKAAKAQSGKAGIWVILLVIAIVLVVVFTGDKSSKIKEYRVSVENISEDQPLSPGVYVIHTADASLNFAGSLSPESLEPLAEYGDHAAFRTFVESVPGVVSVYSVNAPVAPGELSEFVIAIPEDASGPLYFSGIQMAVASNDGYALVDSIPLKGKEAMVEAKNYDNGTEENTELGSGFPGGQPDASRGEENVSNGTATDPQANVEAHPQLTSPVLKLSLTPIEPPQKK